ncbi:Protein phosphatase 4 core regulatory subunit R2 [Trinorchestia longiramus]|nr:Protein phosphatase 4 core regulatory subunit R2 [Trinorchestia longiramus]
MSSAACESNDQDSIDVERLIIELDNFEKLLKEGEESDGGEGVESSSLQAVPSFLDKYLMSIAKTGNPLLPWKKVKTFIHHKIDSILTSFYEKYGIEDVDSQNLPPFNYLPAKEKLLQHFDSFTGAPFTIQRLCEILMDPGRHYRRTDKLLRGLEKNILVVSTIGRLSEDCSNPQQRLMLFNGLQLTNTFRSYRPPLPHHADKFQSPTKDDDEMGPVSRKRPSNGDDSSTMEEDEENFDDDCLKQDLDDEQIEDMDDINPKLASGGSDGESDNYGLSINPAMWRKRKEEQLEDGHAKKIKLSDEEGSIESASPPPSSSRLTTIEKALNEETCESLADDTMEVDEARPPSANESSDKSDDESPSDAACYRIDRTSEPKEAEAEEKAMSPTPEVPKKEEPDAESVNNDSGDTAEDSSDAPDSKKTTSPTEQEKTPDQIEDEVKSQPENSSSSELNEATEDKTEISVSSDTSTPEAVKPTDETQSAHDAQTGEPESKSEDLQETGVEETTQEEKKDE